MQCKGKRTDKKILDMLAMPILNYYDNLDQQLPSTRVSAEKKPPEIKKECTADAFLTDKTKPVKTKPSGLLCFKNFWERLNVELCVNGQTIKGIPIFVEDNTVRVVNREHSYFVPLDKVDFIKTDDGLGNGGV